MPIRTITPNGDYVTPLQEDIEALNAQLQSAIEALREEQQALQAEQQILVDRVDALVDRIATLEEPSPEPPEPPPEEPPPEEPSPEPVLGGSVLEGRPVGINTRFVQPYQPDCAMYADRMRTAIDFGDGIRVGAGGASYILLRGPGATSLDIQPLGERGLTTARSIPQNLDLTLIEVDPEGEFVLPAGTNPALYTAFPQDVPPTLTFDPAHVAWYSRFDVIRTIQLQDTNGLVKLADGSILNEPEGDLVQAGFLEWEEDEAFRAQQGAGAQPWADILGFVAECAEAGTMRGVWLNLPHQASLDYASRLGELARSILPSGFQVLVEAGNELGNTVFPFSLGYEWARARGLRDNLRFGEVNESGTDEYGAAMLDTARRTAQVGQAFREAYAGHGLTHTVYAWMPLGEWGWEDAIAFGRQFGPIHAAALAPYFGRELRFGQFDDASMMRRFTSSLEETLQFEQRPFLRACARASVVPMAYEWGQHAATMTGNYTSAGVIAQQAVRLARSPEMRALYERQLSEWYAQGGGLHCFYAGLCYPNDAENFGLVSHSRSPDNTVVDLLLESRE